MLVVLRLTVFALLALGALATTTLGKPSPKVMPLEMINASGPITVGGISSGAQMAGQFSVAFSSIVDGFYAFAGGPWGCAQGSMSTAMKVCMLGKGSIDLEHLWNLAEDAAAQGNIDDLSNVSHQRVFLFSGSKDSVVVPSVMEAAHDFWMALSPDSLEYVGSVPAQHCYPTEGYGPKCGSLHRPFINSCGENFAFKAMNSIIAADLNPPTAADFGNFFAFDQALYTVGSPARSGLDKTGYIYIPKSCQQDADSDSPCSLHLEFHGCLQSDHNVGAEYRENIGLIEVAEANNIIVVFPQAISSTRNVQGCWDWLGLFDRDAYLFRDGPQLSAFFKMVTAVLDKAPDV